MSFAVLSAVVIVILYSKYYVTFDIKEILIY